MYTTVLLTHLMLHCTYCVQKLQEPSTVEVYSLLEGHKLHCFHLQSSMTVQSPRFWLCHCLQEASSDMLNHDEALCRKSNIPKGREDTCTVLQEQQTRKQTQIWVRSLTIPLDTCRANLSSWLGFKRIFVSSEGSGEAPFEKLKWRNWT